jgi:hypothetical protein
MYYFYYTTYELRLVKRRILQYEHTDQSICYTTNKIQYVKHTLYSYHSSIKIFITVHMHKNIDIQQDGLEVTKYYECIMSVTQTSHIPKNHTYVLLNKNIFLSLCIGGSAALTWSRLPRYQFSFMRRGQDVYRKS